MSPVLNLENSSDHFNKKNKSIYDSPRAKSSLLKNSEEAAIGTYLQNFLRDKKRKQLTILDKPD